MRELGDGANVHHAIIELSDGAGATGRCSSLDEIHLKLDVDGWMTTRGSAITAKCWTLRAIDATRTVWKVIGRCKADD
jgi:hypothetical protein